MDWKFWKGEQVESRASYADTLLLRLFYRRQAQGNLTAKAQQSAAVERLATAVNRFA